MSKTAVRAEFGSYDRKTVEAYKLDKEVMKITKHVYTSCNASSSVSFSATSVIFLAEVSCVTFENLRQDHDDHPDLPNDLTEDNGKEDTGEVDIGALPNHDLL